MVFEKNFDLDFAKEQLNRLEKDLGFCQEGIERIKKGLMFWKEFIKTKLEETNLTINEEFKEESSGGDE